MAKRLLAAAAMLQSACSGGGEALPNPTATPSDAAAASAAAVPARPAVSGDDPAAKSTAKAIAVTRAPVATLEKRPLRPSTDDFSKSAVAKDSGAADGSALPVLPADTGSATKPH